MSTEAIGERPAAADVELVRPGEAEWRQFLQAAAVEGWRVPAGELTLLQGPLAEGALSLQHKGRFAGLVSFVHHGASAWIGNLIVPAAWRGRGYGRLLLEEAMSRLEKRQASSLWLTASEDGFPLYQRRGFETVGAVERWVRPQGGCGSPTCEVLSPGANTTTTQALRRADCRVWNGERALLDQLLPYGRLLRSASNLALLQREPGLQILGPWFSEEGDEEGQRQLLAEAVAAAPSGEELVADVRGGALRAELLEEAGFILRGGTRLMVRGMTENIDLSQLVSFASLGSMG